MWSQLDDVGEVIEKIRIGHNNKGLTPGWHLDRVEVRRLKEDGESCTTYVFPCKRWLAKDEEDGAIVRELVPQKVLEETVSEKGEVKTKEVEQATLDGQYFLSSCLNLSVCLTLVSCMPYSTAKTKPKPTLTNSSVLRLNIGIFPLEEVFLFIVKYIPIAVYLWVVLNDMF